MRDDAVAITFKRIGRFFNNVRSENINFFDWPDSKFPLGHGGERPLDSGKIRDLRIKIDEARFFFGASLRAFLNDMDREAESLLENLGRRYSWEAESDENLWHEIAEELAKNSAALRAYYADMPSRFESSLQLSQLARD